MTTHARSAGASSARPTSPVASSSPPWLRWAAAAPCSSPGAMAVGPQNGRAAEGVEAGVAGYEAVVGSGEVDAVYIALPNSLHAEWTVRALAAGKAVLCEKMLCRHPAELGPVLEAARRPGALLWEAFVFPFQHQHQRLLELVGSGTIGDPCEIVGWFHFRVSQPSNIRLNAELGGGALADVGCYPVRLAQELLGPPPDPIEVWCEAIDHGHDVETDAAAIVGWGAARLMLSVGFHRTSTLSPASSERPGSCA